MECVRHVVALAERPAVVRVGGVTEDAAARRENEEFVILGMLAAVPVGGIIGYQAYGIMGALTGATGLPALVYIAYATSVMVQKRM